MQVDENHGTEVERLAALHALELLDTPRDVSFDTIVTLVARQFDCPIGLVTLVDENRQWFKARCGLDATETSRDFAFCNHTIQTPRLLVVQDATKDPRFEHNPFVVGPPHIRFYAGYPLSIDGKNRLGSLCVVDTVPRTMDEAQRITLMQYGRLVEDLVRLHSNQIALEAAATSSLEKSRELEAKNRLLSKIESMAMIGAWSFDLATERITWSEQIFRLHDLFPGPQPTLDEALAFYPGESRRRIEAAIEEVKRTEKPFEFAVDLMTSAGRKRRVRSAGELESVGGRPVRLVGVLQDITASHEAQHRLWQAARLDFLTGLSNRAHFEECLAKSIQHAEADKSAVALLLIDLDGFKEINDTRGHQAGDEVLKSVAGLLRRHGPAGSTIARLGGDEFAIIIPGRGKRCRPQASAEKVLDALKTPIKTMGDTVVVSATIGIASYPTDALHGKDLLRCADIALYSGKRRERGAVGHYRPEISKLFDKRRVAIETVERAIIGNRLMPYYQPFVRLADRSIYGFEALARIRNIDGSICTAGDFSEAFSDQRSCRRLGERISNLVIADIVNLRSGGINPGVVSLNATEAELHSPGFARRLLKRLQDCAIDPRTLKIEVTETLFLGSEINAVRTELNQLSSAGIIIALDDFGTGFSSLTHLRDFPIDQIKIDKSFVAGLGGSTESGAIIKSLVDLAHML